MEIKRGAGKVILISLILSIVLVLPLMHTVSANTFTEFLGKITGHASVGPTGMAIAPLASTGTEAYYYYLYGADGLSTPIGTTDLAKYHTFATAIDGGLDPASQQWMDFWNSTLRSLDPYFTSYNYGNNGGYSEKSLEMVPNNDIYSVYGNDGTTRSQILNKFWAMENDVSTYLKKQYDTAVAQGTLERPSSSPPNAYMIGLAKARSTEYSLTVKWVGSNASDVTTGSFVVGSTYYDASHGAFGVKWPIGTHDISVQDAWGMMGSWSSDVFSGSYGYASVVDIAWAQMIKNTGASLTIDENGSESTTTTNNPVCGNGKVETGEQCDLGSQNGVSGSGCSSTCQVEGSSATKCTDTDGGKNIYVKGIVNGKECANCYTLVNQPDTCSIRVNDSSGGVNHQSSSSCSGTNCEVLEYWVNDTTRFCNDNFILCPNGCIDGACIPATTTQTACKFSNITKSISVSSSATVNGVLINVTGISTASSGANLVNMKIGSEKINVYITPGETARNYVHDNNNYSISVISATATSAVVNVSILCNRGQTQREKPSVPKCTDSDGGLNETVFGTATNGTITLKDACAESGHSFGIVNEVACAGDNIITKAIPCKDNAIYCSNGACVAQNPNTQGGPNTQKSENVPVSADVFNADQVNSNVDAAVNAQTSGQNRVGLDNNGNYEVTVNKDARLFAVVPVTEPVRVTVDAQTGNVLNVTDPWWGRLAVDVPANRTQRESAIAVSITRPTISYEINETFSLNAQAAMRGNSTLSINWSLPSDCELLNSNVGNISGSGSNHFIGLQATGVCFKSGRKLFGVIISGNNQIARDFSTINILGRSTSVASAALIGGSGKSSEWSSVGCDAYLSGLFCSTCCAGDSSTGWSCDTGNDKHSFTVTFSDNGGSECQATGISPKTKKKT